MTFEKVLSRRDLLKLIGYGAGASVMYQAMNNLSFASTFSPLANLDLSNVPKDATIVILGAGIAGMVAAYELNKAGYKVKVLEYQKRAGGRLWSVYGGDKYQDTDGVTQECRFDKGHYFNVGPWRIPYHHQNVLHYCQMLGVKLDPFVQMNFNAYLHSQKGFGGKPQRYRDVFTDYNGYISELLAKSVHAGELDKTVTKEDKELLLEALKSYGALDSDYRYSKGVISSTRRGFEKTLGGGLSGGAVPTEPLKLNDLLESRVWQNMSYHFNHTFQQTMFEPRGGMEMISRAFGKALGDIIQYEAEITEIDQSDNGVVVTYKDNANGGEVKTESAQWCLCTLPLPVLRKVKLTAADKLKAAINAVNYDSVVKVGVQYKRRFWEQDEAIYGGMTLTDLPISHIAYPCVVDEYLTSGKGIVLNGYIAGEHGKRYTAMALDDRVKSSMRDVIKVHPQAEKEFDVGYSTAWAKVPWIQGAYALWNDDLRKEHYQNLCEIDGRIALAGEHASYMSGWIEGAITSSLDAISRLHRKAVANK